MIKIFIYNSNIRELESIRQSIVDYLNNIRRKFRIIASVKSADTLAYIRKSINEIDIYLIDFSEQETALNLVESVRKCNPNALWVYTGGNVENLLKILYLRPSAYIDSSMCEEEIQNIIKVLDKQVQMFKQNYFFTFKCEGEIINVPYNDILYFESNAKKVALIQKRCNKYSFTSKLDDIAKKVPSFFVRCHQSYLVNMNVVRHLDLKNRVFILDNNEEIWISKRMILETRDIYLQYINNQKNF